MSKASATGQVVFSRRFGSLMTTITSDKGDLFQQYQGAYNSNPTIIPDYTNASFQPTLHFEVTSSRIGQTVSYNSVQWFVNGVAIGWNGDVSTGQFAGCFQKLANIQEIKIIDNLVVAALGTSIILSVKSIVSINGEEDEVGATYSIPISAVTDKGWRNVCIIAGDANYMTIREKNGTCVLKCEVYGTTQATSYKWEQLDGSTGSWVQKQESASNTYTVSESQIDTTGIFRVIAFNDSDEIGRDQATVLDLSDPLYVVPNPIKKRSNGTIMSNNDDALRINDTDPDGCYVMFAPKLYSRETNTEWDKTTPSYQYFFSDYAGNQLIDANNHITKDMCVQAGDVSFYITASF